MGRRPEEVSEPAARQVGERASERVSAPVLSPRSVVFRAEIGPVPARDRSAQLSEIKVDILTRIGWHYGRCDPRAQLSRERSQRTASVTRAHFAE